MQTRKDELNEALREAHSTTVELFEADESEISRDPSDYRPTDHFVIRSKREYGPADETRTDPLITPEVTRKCITNGHVIPARDDRKKFITMVGGYVWHLVVLDDLVLTAYAPAEHDGDDVSVGVDR